MENFNYLGVTLYPNHKEFEIAYPFNFLPLSILTEICWRISLRVENLGVFNKPCSILSEYSTRKERSQLFYRFSLEK